MPYGLDTDTATVIGRLFDRGFTTGNTPRTEWTRLGQTYRYLDAVDVARDTITFDEAFDRWPLDLTYGQHNGG